MSSIVQLNIALKDSQPLIWRGVQVHSTISFYELHHIVQICMGWLNAHLFEFRVDGRFIGMPDEDDEDPMLANAVLDARKLYLEEVIQRPSKPFRYVYDFGDNWVHEITVDKILPTDAIFSGPICVNGAQNCPPEDCGGIWGFYELLDKWNDEQYLGRGEIIDWLGEYDPSAFDLLSINNKLEHLDQIIEKNQDIAK